MANVPLASLHCLRSELTSCSPGQIETNDQLSFWSLLYNVKQQDPTLCRICLDEQPLDALVSVCLCAGSMKYVHRHCIQCWLNKRINEQEETEGPVSLAC